MSLFASSSTLTACCSRRILHAAFSTTPAPGEVFRPFVPPREQQTLVDRKARSPTPEQLRRRANREKEQQWKAAANLQLPVVTFDNLVPEPEREELPIETKRKKVIARLQSAVRRRFGRGYTVETFGSVRYGLAQDTSDLDLVILDPKAPRGGRDSPDKIYRLSALRDCLAKAGFQIIWAVPRASVPIIKFVDPFYKIQCDLNVNDRLGVINSDLIKTYCSLTPTLPEMLRKIKAWAKPLGLNDPSAYKRPVTFSSYALALMTIGFLQTKGVLPNLQGNLPEWSKEERAQCGIWSAKPFRINDTRYETNPTWTAPDVDVDALVKEWFQFWRDFDYEKTVMSVRDGGVIPCIWDSQHYVFVHDVFIHGKNVCGNIGPGVLSQFKEECDKVVCSRDD